MYLVARCRSRIKIIATVMQPVYCVRGVHSVSTSAGFDVSKQSFQTIGSISDTRSLQNEGKKSIKVTSQGLTSDILKLEDICTEDSPEFSDLIPYTVTT